MNNNQKDNIIPEINGETMFISVNEAVKITGIGRNTMLELVKLKGFPAFIKPKKIWIDKEELPVWLRKNYGRYKC